MCGSISLLQLYETSSSHTLYVIAIGTDFVMRSERESVLVDKILSKINSLEVLEAGQSHLTRKCSSTRSILSSKHPCCPQSCPHELLFVHPIAYTL
jgi:hypothetical protein